jgi:hypothetical protein
MLFVANINGQPTEKNGMGFISTVDMEGHPINLEWVKGLNAPKGMGIVGNSLYVTDIDRVVEIDIELAEITRTYDVQEAVFLNDIDVDAEGKVYVSDMQDSVIYRISDGEIAPWLTDSRLRSPNGLYVFKDQLLIGISGQVLSSSLNDPMPELFIDGTGGIDGIEWVTGQTFIISDWQGNVHLVHPDKEMIKVLNTTPAGVNAADIEFIPGENVLLVPTFFDNRIYAYRLEIDE